MSNLEGNITQTVRKHLDRRHEHSVRTYDGISLTTKTEIEGDICYKGIRRSNRKNDKQATSSR